MTIHNTMEEVVKQKVAVIFDQAVCEKQTRLTCDCHLCRLDVICFVLNRIQPQYIVSSQGVAFSQTCFNQQLLADIDILIMNAIHIVNNSKRPHADHTPENLDLFRKSGPVYNFPTFVGTILDGLTFTPLKEVCVSLYHKNEIVKMIDSSWANPYTTNAKIPGTFTFWAEPQKTAEEGNEAVYQFQLKIEAQGYDSLSYFFDVSVKSNEKIFLTYKSEFTHKIPDLYIFPIGS